MVVQTAVNEVPQSEAAAVRNLAALIEGMRIGQERALEELYDATVGKLYALASAILRSAEDTEEIVCETYAYAWANASRFDASRANALGWLLMLCRSRALDRLRQRRATASALEVAALHEASASAFRSHLCRSLALRLCGWGRASQARENIRPLLCIQYGFAPVAGRDRLALADTSGERT